MRILLTIIVLLTFFSPKAQTHLPLNGSGYGYSPWQPFSGLGYRPSPFPDSSRSNQKWHLSKYAGFSAGAMFFPGGGASFVSAPLGLQLSHPLTNNLSAFAGVSVAPVLLNFSGPFAAPVYNHSYPNPSYPGSLMGYYPGINSSRPYGLGLSSRVEMGLMYTNDDKTFSISGSVGIERSSYPVYAPASNRGNTKR